MAARGWAGSILTAIGAAAGAGAAQLGLGYGLGIISWLPASDPAGRISVPKAPTGSRDLGFHDITSFGDELSSLRFGFE